MYKVGDVVQYNNKLYVIFDITTKKDLILLDAEMNDCQVIGLEQVQKHYREVECPL